jgi:hypothetical protein
MYASCTGVCGRAAMAMIAGGTGTWDVRDTRYPRMQGRGIKNRRGGERNRNKNYGVELVTRRTGGRSAGSSLGVEQALGDARRMKINLGPHTGDYRVMACRVDKDRR